MSLALPPRRWLIHLSAVASLLALFLVVVGARLWLVQTYSTSLPYADQWDGEAAGFLKPWAEGTLPWRNLFLPHNEHRIALTRALFLALFAANKQWDPQLEMAVNAGLCGLFAVLLAGGLIGGFGERWRWLIILAVAVTYTLPFGWENTLGGFQSQNYFLIFFSLTAIWGLGLHRAGSLRWWAGLGGLLLACLSMGSGFLAAVATLSLPAARAVKERTRPGPREWTTATVCLGAIAVGWLTRLEVPTHAFLRAASPGAFASAFCRFAAWPLYQREAWLVPMLFPLGLLATGYVLEPLSRWRARSDQERRRIELLLATGGWALLQTAALAYSRDGHGAPPACRYMDLLAILPLTCGLAAALLVATTAPGPVRWLTAAMTFVWLGLLANGLLLETRRDFQNWLPDHYSEQLWSEENVRGYLATGDFRRYLAAPPPNKIPYPNPAMLATILDDPTVRAFLPADIRAPLPLQVTGEAFTPTGIPLTLAAIPWLGSWGSYGAENGTAEGVVIRPSTASPVLPYLQFRFAGDLGEPGLSFELNDGTNDQVLNWHPAHVPHEHWRVDYLRRPGNGDLHLRLSDTNPAKWFAFTAPVEVGAWSYWAGFVLRRGGTLSMVGASPMVLLLLRNILSPRARSD